MRNSTCHWRKVTPSHQLTSAARFTGVSHAGCGSCPSLRLLDGGQELWSEPAGSSDDRPRLQ
jgi:hypothetical protein